MKGTVDVRRVVLGVPAGLLIVSPGAVSMPVNARLWAATQKVQGGWIFDDKPITSVLLSSEVPGALVEVFIYKGDQSYVPSYTVTIASDSSETFPAPWAVLCDAVQVDNVSNFDWSGINRYEKNLDLKNICSNYTVQLGGNASGNVQNEFTINQLRLGTKSSDGVEAWYPGDSVEDHAPFTAA